MASPNNIDKIKNDNFLKEYEELKEKHQRQIVSQPVPYPLMVKGLDGKPRMVWAFEIVNSIAPVESKIVTPNKKVAPKVEIKK